jgi:hypothetical protein
MNLMELMERGMQLAKAIEDTTQSVFILRGHKAEVDFQISELQRLAVEADEAARQAEEEARKAAEEADKVPQPVVNC